MEVLRLDWEFSIDEFKTAWRGRFAAAVKVCVASKTVVEEDVPIVIRVCAGCTPAAGEYGGAEKHDTRQNSSRAFCAAQTYRFTLPDGDETYVLSR
jgi:hypothetical protein